MTKLSKCEICRVRKIKCDEIRPNCGACETKGREWFYKHNKDDVFVHEQFDISRLPNQSRTTSAATSGSSSHRSDNPGRQRSKEPATKAVTFRLRRSRKAQTGAGAYFIFGRPTRHPVKVEIELSTEDEESATYRRRITLSPLPMVLLTRSQDSLASKWISIAGSASLDLYPLGKWVKLAWDHVGRNSYLDLAVEYALSAMTGFRQHSRSDSVNIPEIGGRAMRSLRQAIMAGTNDIDVYVAVMLHYAAEVSRVVLCLIVLWTDDGSTFVAW